MAIINVAGTVLAKDGERYSRTKAVHGHVVTVHHVTVHGTKDSQEYALTWMVDFEGVSREAILKLASETVVIGYRHNFKKCAKSEIPGFDNHTISVKQYLARERVAADPVTQTKRDLERLAPDVRRTLLEEALKQLSETK